ncbi:MAG TPA: GxxExxY protein [Longimicrobiaceae bacterium]
MKTPVEAAAAAIVDASVRVHRQLGPGLLESMYQACLAQELRDRGNEVECEVPFPIRYGSVVIATAFRVDMVIDRVVLVENKSVQSLLPVHEAQLLTYLRLSGHQLGFLINWNVPTIREGLKRIAYRL